MNQLWYRTLETVNVGDRSLIVKVIKRGQNVYNYCVTNIVKLSRCHHHKVTHWTLSPTPLWPPFLLFYYRQRLSQTSNSPNRLKYFNLLVKQSFFQSRACDTKYQNHLVTKKVFLLSNSSPETSPINTASKINVQVLWSFSTFLGCQMGHWFSMDLIYRFRIE